ncbi:MAG: TonB-dependent receptor [Vicinamibacteria bacterium]|nr:TonB-dependent receptor [Vicinamibacteria bacterium]
MKERRGVDTLAGLLLAAVVVLAPVVAVGQVLYGSIVGTVTDSSGATIPGATVTIVNTETNLTRTAVTDGTGAYSFANAIPGSYTVTVALEGFRESVRTGLPVSVNTISRADVKLEIGALTETVTVASSTQLLQTDKADVSTELRSKEIVDLPLAAYRNYQTLVNLVPGATPAVFQNSEVDTPGRALSTNVNGVNRNNNGTKTDGATNVNIWLPHHTMYVSPAETVDTVNISSSSFDAEQGMAGGAAITVVTKSGTNALKGAAFAFYNGEELNARKYFSATKTQDSSKIFGGTLGGPIKKDKLFYFGAWEGQYQATVNEGFFNVPPAALRGGNFSQAFNTTGTLQVIYDPRTGNPDGSGRTPFPGNVIPADRLSPIAQRIQALYPNSNLPGTAGANVGGANINRNFNRLQPRNFERNNYDGKVNWNRTASNQIWGKYSRMGANVQNLWKLGYDDPGSGDTTVQQYTFGSTLTINSTTVADITYGVSKMDHITEPGDFSLGNFGLETLGIPGTNGGRLYSGDPRYAGMPTFFTGFSDLGNTDGWTPVERDERTYALGANVTKLLGKHEIRTGYALNLLRLDHWQPELGAGPRGTLTFGGNDTALRGGQTANFYNQYATFLLGDVTRGQATVQYELLTAREQQHGLYIRDRWNINEKMTLDLGLRWEYYPLMTRADRGLETVDLQTLEVLLGGRGGNPDDLGIKVAKDLFAPRLGFIYRLNENTVFRTGFGRTFNPLPFARPLRGFYPATISGDFVPIETFGSIGTLATGIPDITGPDLNSGRFPLPNTYDMRFPENDVSRGHVDSWNVAVERRLPFDLSVDMAYVGTRTKGGFADLDINASDTPGGGVASRPFFNQFGRRISLLSWGPHTKTEYHALQVAINRPFKNGLLLKGAYTLSKAENETDDDGWAGLSWNGASQLGRNFALAGYDRTHIFQMAFVYEVPYKTGTGGNPALKAVFGDWQINGIYSAFSGTPFTITADGSLVNAPGNLQTADQVGDYTILGNVGSEGKWFDTDAFRQPTGVRYGDTGRNAFRGPGQWNLDFSLFRAFRLGGTRQFEIRSEFFNLTNTPKWGNPSNSVTSSTFGQTFSVAGERTIRLGGRFSF